jgi:DNA-binding CsgD family transcriptional regulator
MFSCDNQNAVPDGLYGGSGMTGFEKLASCSSREALTAAASQCALEIGFELWSLAMHIPAAAARPWDIGNMPPALLRARMDCFLSLADPAGMAWLQHGLPCRWLSDEPSQGEDRPRECAERFRAQARREGVHGGLCVPVPGPDGAAGSLALAVRHPRDQDALDKLQPQALLYSRHLLRACQPLMEADRHRQAPRISRREMECLSWAAIGKTTWEISRVMDISEHTVIYYLRNAARKLGAVNRQQAVTKSIELGMLDRQGRIRSSGRCNSMPVPVASNDCLG